jgi:acetolactate synthase-1/2/3 large subunit
VAAGVERAFTVPGESFLPLLDALVAAGVRVVATRHEGGAAFMAEATGKLTGRPAVCIGTRGVGTANLSIGIHTARQDSTPMIAVAGQVAREFRGREAFQEVELAGTFGGLAIWATELDDPARVPALVREGLRTMVARRPGPVFFAVPEDVFDATVADGAGAIDLAAAPVPEPPADDVRAVIDLLAGARRPVILAGGGILRAGASADLVAFAAALDVPVVTAFRRTDAFPNDHPLFLGHAGYGAARTVLPRLLEADALLVIGCRLSETVTYDYRVPTTETRWAHVDLEPRQVHAGLSTPDIPLEADAGAFLRAALATLGRGPDRMADPDRRAANAWDRAAFENASVVDGEPWDGPGVHPGRVITTLRRVLPPEGILTTDAGNFGLWAGRGFRFLRPGTFLGPTSGAMGYGLPAAIAASLARPSVPVVGLAGDGGFAMSMSELETAVRERTSPVMLVFDNRRYGTIGMHQHRGGRAAIATDLGPIDFAAVAEASGALGLRVDRDDSFEPALRLALGSDRPAVIHLEVDPRWVSPDDTPGSPRGV